MDEIPTHYAAEAHVRYNKRLRAYEERWLIPLPAEHVLRGDVVTFEPWGRWVKVWWPRFFAWKYKGAEVYVEASNTRGYRIVGLCRHTTGGTGP